MYDFKLLDAFYDVDITLEYPNYRHTYYHCREHLTARYKKEENMYSVQLEERGNVLLDHEPPKETMDILMTEIGDSIYPVSLRVSPMGEIVQVSNFDHVKRRWLIKTDELRRNYSTYPFARYIEIASRNMKDESKFREALTRNTFVKLVLKPLDAESFAFSFNDFPSKGMISMFHCTRKRHYEKSGIVLDYQAKLIFPLDYEGDGYIKYTFSELRDITQIDARFDITDTEGQKSVKYISIKTDQRERSISGKKSFWSKMLE